jgi:hypothetical protein
MNPLKKRIEKRIRNAFSFLEVIGVLLLLSLGLLSLFPLIRTVQSSQSELFFHYKALKIAENHLLELFSNRSFPLGNSEIKVQNNDKTFQILCSISRDKNGGKLVSIQVHYPSGINHESTAVLSTFVFP